MNPARCPSLAELEELLARDAAATDAHVASCPDCRSSLDELRANLDLAAKVRAVAREPPSADRAAAPAPATTLPGFQLQGVLNEGAQGVVHRALQESTKRVVAIKFLHLGAFSSARQRRRFEREIDLAASLRHPGIVTVHESGVAPGGQLYCVMEFVDGVPIDEYVRPERRAGAASLPTRAIVELFVRVCDAVHHAHRHGVLHRDLKPGNVFVDRQGEPRVLDFGLARTLLPDESTASSEAGEAARQESLATRAGEFLGTFAYASPEQVDADPGRVDVRSDVYSLGVILFELLVGARPYELTGNVAASVRTILETLPAPPSRRGARSDRDLDTIVLRALAKDRERRYGSAGDFAADLRNWLAGRPIDARRDRRLYVLRKSLQHHWLASSAITAICVVSLVAAVVSNHFRGVADSQTARATDEALRANRKAQESERVRQLLEELITANDPERTFGRDPTVRETLEQAGPRVVAALADAPLVQAMLQLSIGRAFMSLHDPARAEPPLAAALATFERLEGADHPDTWNARGATIDLRLQQARWDEAESMAVAALAQLERSGRGASRMAADLLGDASAAALGRTDLPVAITRAEQALALLQSVPERDEIACAQAQAELATLRGNHDELGPAELLMKEALATLRRHADERPALLVHALLMAQGLARLRRGYEDAAKLLDEAHALCTQLYGAEDSESLRIELAKLDAEWRAHDFRGDADEVAAAARLEPLLVGRTDPDALEALTTLANFAASTHDLRRAERLSRLVVDACDRRGTARDVVLFGATELLGAALAMQERWTDAEPVLARALALGEALRGSNPGEDAEEKLTHKTTALLAKCRLEAKDVKGAAALARRSLAALKPGVREDPDLLTFEGRMARAFAVAGDRKLAEQVGRHAVERLRADGGDLAPALAEAAEYLAEIVREDGKLDEAQTLAELALAAAQAHADVSRICVANALLELGINQLYRDHLAAAEEKFAASLEVYDELGLETNGYRLSALRNLGMVRVFREEFADAEPPLEELVEIYRQPADPRTLGELLSHLGQAYAGSKKLDEADATLRESYDLLAKSYPPTHDWMKGTLAAWIAVNQKLGHADEVERLEGLQKAR